MAQATATILADVSSSGQEAFIIQDGNDQADSGTFGGTAGLWQPEDNPARLEEHLLDFIHSVGREVKSNILTLDLVWERCRDHGYFSDQIRSGLDNCVEDGSIQINPEGTHIALAPAMVLDSQPTWTPDVLHTTTTNGSGENPRNANEAPGVSVTSTMDDKDDEPSGTGLTMLVPAMDCHDRESGSPPSEQDICDCHLNPGNDAPTNNTDRRPDDAPRDSNARCTNTRTRAMIQECKRDLKVIVTRLPTNTTGCENDLLGRILNNKDTEADCVRAETSRIMEEDEVRQHLRSRHSELAFSCGRPLQVRHPDVTSTPRPDCGGLNDTQSRSPRKERGRPGNKKPRTFTTPYTVREETGEDEILRSGADQQYAEGWNVSLDDLANPRGADNNNNNEGLNLDAASINALASSLKESIKPQPSNNAGQDNHEATFRSSTPKEDVPLPDGDDPMGSEANVSSGSRKRTRGGRKHKKGEASSSNSQEVDPKQPRTNTGNTPSGLSPRGRGRPPGSLNKKYSQERKSVRQMKLISANVGEQQQQERERAGAQPRSSTSSGSTESSVTEQASGEDLDDTAAGEPMDDHPPQQRPHRPNEENRQGQSSGSQHAAPGHSGTYAPTDQDQRSQGLAPAAPWSTEEIAAISEVIGQRCAGGSAEYLASDEPGLDPVEMDYLPSALDQSLSVNLDETRVFDMRDLVSNDIDIRRGSKIRTRDVVQFVLLARPRLPSDRMPLSATPWMIPDLAEFHDLINRAECHMIENKMTCYKARKWSNLWGKVGLVGLSPKTPEHIPDYRAVVEAMNTDKLTFTLFPKEAVENRGSVSVILREQFRSFNIKCLPASLFNLNRGLAGSLRVTHSKTYTASDKTRAGTSKEGWRLLLLQGCPAFMKSLEKYDEDERFSLGSGYIYIRGGVRKPRPTPPSSSGRPQPGRSTGKGDQGHDPNGKRNKDNNGLNRQHFPRLTEAQNEEQRDGGRGQRNGGGSSRGREPTGPANRRGTSFSWGGQ